MTVFGLFFTRIRFVALWSPLFIWKRIALCSFAFMGTNFSGSVWSRWSTIPKENRANWWLNCFVSWVILLEKHEVIYRLQYMEPWSYKKIDIKVGFWAAMAIQKTRRNKEFLKVDSISGVCGRAGNPLEMEVMLPKLFLKSKFYEDRQTYIFF